MQIYETKLDGFRHPFIQFNEKFEWPALHLDVRKSEPENLEKLLLILQNKFPGGLKEFSLLPEPKPKKEDGYLHFVRRHFVKNREYLYLIKISGRYMGGAEPSEIIIPPAQNYSPSYLTNKIYYHIRIFPVEHIIFHNSTIIDFIPRKFNEVVFFKHEGLKDKHMDITSPLFDDLDFRSIENNLTEGVLGEETIKSEKLRLFVIEYMTLCLNPLISSFDQNFEDILIHFDIIVDLLFKEQTLEKLDISERQFWNKYFLQHLILPELSRSGNPQWTLLSLSSHGIHLIDCNLHQKEIVAVYILQEKDDTVIIETGVPNSVSVIMNTIIKRKISVESIKWIFVTHVHLDHSGGAAGLLKLCPNARLVCHPLGAKHLHRPERLIAGARVVYGEDRFNEFIGTEIDSVPLEKIQPADDGEIYNVGGRKLQIIHTKGHANHHFCILDIKSGAIFTGDTFGISYPFFKKYANLFIYPAATPVEFNIDESIQTIQKILSYKPKFALLTHFGIVEDIYRAADMLFFFLEQIRNIFMKF
ncbi:MAG: MBL fold metallo-hydrolase, partial [Spirochaetia bacterium]|nr:MBL fold metallo-hydrolase [Spirochaetia bacterium]